MYHEQMPDLTHHRQVSVIKPHGRSQRLQINKKKISTKLARPISKKLIMKMENVKEETLQRILLNCQTLSLARMLPMVNLTWKILNMMISLTMPNGILISKMIQVMVILKMKVYLKNLIWLVKMIVFN